MKIEVSQKKFFETPSPIALIFVFSEEHTFILPTIIKTFTKETQTLLKRIQSAKEFSGASNQSFLVHLNEKEKCERILLVGLGAREKFNLEIFSHSLGSAAMKLQQQKFTKSSIFFPEEIFSTISTGKAGLFLVKAIKLAQWQFNEFRKKKDHLPKIESLIVSELAEKYQKSFLEGIKEGEIIVEAVNSARFLGDLPPAISTPKYLADFAKNVSKENKNTSVKVLGRKEMEKLGMGGVLAVSAGSGKEPQFIILEYWGAPKTEKPIVFVGKGITFDSGGLNLKASPDAMIHEMKWDMCGGANVMCILKAVAQLGLKKNVVGIVPASENLLGENAYKPGDILRMMNGSTVLVENTDAEGRIVLADGITYARRYKPHVIFDIATLTGACMKALGFFYDGLFTRDDALATLALSSSEETLDKLWRLPLNDDYANEMKGEVSDLGNIGKSGGLGGASTAAGFLETFAEGTRYAHLDIAPTGWITRPRSWMRAGATGVGVHWGVEMVKKL